METYQKDNITLIHGDCIDYMRSLPDKSVDLVLTDPPYEMEIHGGTGYNDFSTRKLVCDKHIAGICNGFDYERVFNEFLRLCRIPNILIFCSNNQVGKIMGWFEHRDLAATLLVWNKTNPIPLCYNKYLSDVEFIVYVHGKGATFNNDSPYDYKRKVYTSNVVGSKERIHPTEKPVKYLMQLIELHSAKGDCILDPFGGSMSTGVAAMNLGRRFIGIEIDETYYNAAVKRVKAVAAQPRLEL